MKIIKSWPTLFLTLIFLALSGSFLIYAQTPTDQVTPTPNQQETSDLSKKIQDLESKISDLKSQENSLSSQIDVFDSQIKLTEYRINANKQEVDTLTQDISTAGGKMKNLESSLSDVSKVLINRIVATYEAGGIEPIHVLASSNDISSLVAKANYLRLVQAHDKRLMYNAQQAKNDYANQKNIFEDKKKKIEALKVQLEDYNNQLDQQKGEKQKLLSETQGSEGNYQQLLAEAKAQISGFRSFATSQGGSILPPQPSPDGWYYNQRDSRWGNDRIGASSESVWEVGCLLTSVAMVMKKHGNNVTPADVARNSSYFFSDTAFMSLPWGGGRFSSSWGNNQSAIDSKLASGEPVIVGVRGGAHFVVLKSGSGGNYIMNDPWNGPDLNFSSYYSSISQYGWYN